MLNPHELQQKTPEELTRIILCLQQVDKEKQIELENKMVAQQQAHQETQTELKNKIATQQQLIDYLYEQNRLLKHGRFGKSSEKYLDPNPQGRLFDEAVPLEDSKEIESAEVEIQIPAHTRKKPGRKPLPKEYPRIEILHDLSDAEKVCACGHPLTCIGDERTEQLDIIPEKIYVLVHVHKKYACSHCEETIKTATKPKQPIPQSIAAPGLLAHVLTRKFQFHLPLYRQEQLLQSIGVDIPRATLSHWVIQCGRLLQPLVNLLEDEIRGYDVAYSDESTVQVLKEPDKPAESQSYMWCFSGGTPNRFSYVYHYHPNRSYQKVIDFFADFKGYLHCDGYQAYDNLKTQYPAITLVGCWYHVRRKFVEAAKVSHQKGLANYFIEQIQKLSKIEKAIQANGFNPNDARSYRQAHAQKTIQKIKTKLDDYQSKVSSQSLLGKAIGYALNQWPKLLTYLKDGRLEISNNRMERAIKPFTIGRKNWLFANSVDGAKAAAIIYSLIETCKAHQVNPYDWLRDTLTQIPNCQTVEAFEVLLPFNFKN